ncbi:hypothetical protein EJ05DRAFT_484345 [Pseudovirgaria hyperparasitica]|uniref:Uncharacterized protein n=1 Tax=Pseudovirgaria hyperparasitica TaxID=470096 RepID=A0A6A6WF79_9PEZI|nr:uncharacterized protein EJ05DRAFT_484345 [Pseudovirgaria hyperparasitica]KAF2760640.1 hypothetical protein EJ05DRAFT_484345 [Pseudovirgaria hyperparasitica]
MSMQHTERQGQADFILLICADVMSFAHASLNINAHFSRLVPLLVPIIQGCLLSSLVAAVQDSDDCPTQAHNNATTRYLNLTAINAVDGKSVLECWQLGPFATSSVSGTTGSLALFLGDTSNATYSVLPPRYVFFASGLAHVTLPESSDDAWIQGGKYGLVIAADTSDISEKGHITTYPSDDDTIGLQVPLKDGKRPKYSLLHAGACRWEDVVGS